jgi:hypothetical protein
MQVSNSRESELVDVRSKPIRNLFIRIVMLQPAVEATQTVLVVSQPLRFRRYGLSWYQPEVE